MSVIHRQVEAMAGAEVQVLYCDPPWLFNGNSKAKPGRNARRHYPCMTDAEIASIPVKAMVAKEAALFMWITGPKLIAGSHLGIMKAWGFEPSGSGFVWVKTKRSHVWHKGVLPTDLHWGNGLTTVKNAEFCIIGKRKRSLRVKTGVHEIIMAPAMDHSRKPLEVARRIKEYVGPGRRMVEMFSKSTYPGFEPLGDQVGFFDVAAE